MRQFRQDPGLQEHRGKTSAHVQELENMAAILNFVLRQHTFFK